MEIELRLLIDHIREELPDEISWTFPGERTPTGVPPLTVGLARFQSYRARTEAALVQELSDYIEEAGLNTVHFKVVDDQSTVLVW